MATVSKSYIVSSTESHEYLVSDANGVFAFGTVSNLVDNETRTLNINLTSYKTITLSTGVSGLSSVKFKLAGKLVDATEISSGNYSIKIADGSVSSSIEIPYYIVDNNYAPYYSSLTFSGSNVTESITLTSCTKSTFTRPDLTANGVLGGSSFAVYAENYNSVSIYGAWRAVDNNTNTYWMSPYIKDASVYYDYIIYNPNFFQINTLTLTAYSNSSAPYNTNVYTSIDGINWDLDQTISANTTSTLTINMNSTIPYKYIKLNMNGDSSSYIYLTNITFANAYEWIISNTFDITVNTTPADAVVLFNASNVSGKTATIGYAGVVQYTVAKSGYKPVSGTVSTINTDKTVNVSLTEQETPNMTWHAWTNNGTTIYTQTETPVADLDWTFSAPNTIANLITATGTNTITSNGVTYTKATASNIESYLDTQYYTIQTDANTSNNTEFYLPIHASTPYALTVNWGDGNTELIQGQGTYPHHTYSTKGTYQISIKSDLYKMPTLTNALYNDATYKAPNKQLKSMDSFMLPMYYNYLENVNSLGSFGYITYTATNLTKTCSSFIEKANLTDYRGLFYGDSALTTIKGVNLEEEININNAYKYYQTFYNCSSLQGGVNLSNLTTISNENSLTSTFLGCTGLTSVDLSNLTTISSYGMYQTFYNCSGLTSVNLSSLITISGSYAMQYAFQGCTSLTSIAFPNLTTVSGDSSMQYIFYNCTGLTSAEFPNLTTISGGSGMREAFWQCSNLTSITFPKLSTLNGSAFYNAFNRCTKLSSVSFPALTSNSFGSSYTNQFNNMLAVCSNVTVHFPTIIKETIQDWPDVQAGFGGTNTTVLFDIGGCEVTFNCTPSTNNQIWIKDRTISGNTSWEVQEATVPYQVFNTDNYQLYVGSVNVPASSSATVNVDTTTATSEIKINTGVSGLTVTYNVSGQFLPALDNNNGTYSLFITAPSNTSINYSVNGGDNYTDASGTLTYAGSSITENVTLTPATTSTFTQPVLTANGTLGGDSFAADVSSTNITYRSYAYKLFDGDTSTNPFGWNWYISGSPWYWICYNPNPIKITSFIEYWTNTGTSYIPTYINIYGSSDGSNWTLVKSITRTNFNNSTQTINVNSQSSYKYHKVEYKGSDYVQLKEITLTATVKTPAS